MAALSYKDYKRHYKKYGKLINQVSTPKNALNERQIKSRYKDYLKSEEKRKNRRIRINEKIIKKTEIFDEDIKWKNLKEKVFERDSNKCQLYFYVPDSLKETIDSKLIGSMANLDPCHIFGKGAYPHLKYDIDNVVTLYRLFHTRLDQYKNPFTGELITKDERNNYWKQIVGQKRFQSLQSKAKRR